MRIFGHTALIGGALLTSPALAIEDKLTEARPPIFENW
jgi:hypothetical protein